MAVRAAFKGDADAIEGDDDLRSMRVLNAALRRACRGAGRADALLVEATQPLYWLGMVDE